MTSRCRMLLLLALLAPPGAAAADAAEPSRTFASTGKIERAGEQAIVMRRLGQTTQPNAPPVQTIRGGQDVPVSGEGRSDWSKLRRGDLVVVSYRLEPEPVATKVLVLPMTAHPMVAASLGVTPAKTAGRQFTGWVKYKDESLLVVRTPDSLPPRQLPGKVRTFVRHEGTKVTLFRDSWEELKKGDRVIVHFSKGNPRPADLVKVVLRGGEKPLPPGLATRLYDPTYDTSVKDVDGIGEVPAGAWQEPGPTRESASN